MLITSFSLCFVTILISSIQRYKRYYKKEKFDFLNIYYRKVKKKKHQKKLMFLYLFKTNLSQHEIWPWFKKTTTYVLVRDMLDDT